MSAAYEAISMIRKALPAVAVVICAAASVPASAQVWGSSDSATTGSTVMNYATRAAMNGNNNSNEVNAAATLMSAWGASAGKNIDAAKAKQANDDAVRAQVHAEAVRQQAIKEEAARIGVSYDQLAKNMATSTAYLDTQGSAFDRLAARISAPRARP